MPKIAKLRKPERHERDVWEAVIRYANANPDDNAEARARDFASLIRVGFDWIGGDGREDRELKDDVELCEDSKDGTSLDVLADRYRLEFRNMLAWLVAPDKWFHVSDLMEEFDIEDSVADAGEFLNHHASNIRMSVYANTNFIPRGKIADNAVNWLMTIGPEQCASVISPVCKFILDQIIRHDKGGEELQKVIPIAQCERPGCGRFFIVERAGRARFCSTSCRARAYQDTMTKEAKAARQADYRARLKEREAREIEVALGGKKGRK